MVDEVRDTFGKWWRASRYESKNDCIVPTADASFEEYDPWDGFQVGNSVAPYDALFELLRAVRSTGMTPFRLTETGKGLILDWCREHGLLGILPHRLIAAHMQPLYEPFDIANVAVQSRVDASVLAPTQRRIVRTPAGWRLSATVQSLGNRSVVIVDEPQRAGTSVETEHWPDKWPKPGVMLRSLDGQEVTHQGFREEWVLFFPGLEIDECERYQYPHPGSLEFQKIYGEHFALFLQTASLLENALRVLGRAKPVAKLAEAERYQTIAANRDLNGLVLPVSSASRLEDNGAIRPIWVSSSLLATYATMVLRGLGTAGTRLVTCEVCAKPFVTTRSTATYCSERCRRTGQKRNQRRRIREGKQS